MDKHRFVEVRNVNPLSLIYKATNNTPYMNRTDDVARCALKKQLQTHFRMIIEI